MNFNLTDLTLHITTDSAPELRQWLMLRGADFGASCRTAACRTPERECEKCRASGSCAWYPVFGQQLTVDPEALRRHQKPPLPFVFSFSASNAPQSLECRLVVAGTAIQCLDMLLSGFSRLLERDDCPADGSVDRIVSHDYQGSDQVLGEGGRVTKPENLLVLSAGDILDSRPWGTEHLQILLQSPLRLVTDGRSLSHFDFSVFARSLFRRVSSIAYYYGDHELEYDFSELASQAGRIICTEDNFSYDSGAGGGRKLSGIRGSGTFTGNFVDIMPFIAMGVYLHAGKGPTYGMGAFTYSSR